MCTLTRHLISKSIPMCSTLNVANFSSEIICKSPPFLVRAHRAISYVIIREIWFTKAYRTSFCALAKERLGDNRLNDTCRWNGYAHVVRCDALLFYRIQRFMDFRSDASHCMTKCFTSEFCYLSPRYTTPSITLVFTQTESRLLVRSSQKPRSTTFSFSLPWEKA